MTLSEIFRQAIATFRAHKMRTFLTMFGIVWGIASVIILVGLGRGFVVDQKKHMETLGKDLVIMWGGRTSSQVGGRAAGREIPLHVDDAELIVVQVVVSQSPASTEHGAAERGGCEDLPALGRLPGIQLDRGEVLYPVRD